MVGQEQIEERPARVEIADEDRRLDPGHPGDRKTPVGHVDEAEPPVLLDDLARLVEPAGCGERPGAERGAHTGQ